MILKTRELILLAGVILLLTAGGAALAASSYTIDWWTVNGGGATSSGGAYSLSSTIGQPDAGVLAGGDYALHGGFWQCVVSVAVSTGIAAVSGDIQLSWTGPTANVYRAVNDPYFDPGAAYASGVSSIWTDSAAAGNPANNHTYIIRASGSCGESANSQRLGEFDFALVPGS